MKRASPEQQQLIDAASAHGYEVTPKQIDRYRAEQVLPSPGRAGRGRGRGVHRPLGERDAEQLVRLCAYLDEDRSLHRAAFRLWVEDYEVPLARVRRALRCLAPDPRKIASISDESLATQSHAFSEQLLERKRVPSRVKKMIRAGTLQPLINSTLAMGLNRPRTQDDKTFADTFEKFSGMDRGRVDHWEGKQPWLSDDSSPRVAEIAEIAHDLSPELAVYATDEELLQAKALFIYVEKLGRCVEFLQERHGENAFGLSMLVRSPLGVPRAQEGPVLFLGLLLIARANPSLVENITSMGVMLDQTLRQIQELRQQQKAGN